MKIRAAKHSDIPYIAKIAQDVYKSTFGDEMTTEDLESELESRNSNYFSQKINEDIILVAEDGNLILGFIQFGDVSYSDVKVKKEDLELNKIYVQQNQHGKGIGKKLIEAMLSHEKVQPNTDFYLDVYAKNEKATGLYKKYGFIEIGKVPFEVDGRVVGYDILMKKAHN